jgi:uncharacterized protein YxjI
MAIPVTCRCGRSYNLKDEFAGKVVQCPHCAGTIEVPALVRVPAAPQAHPAFDRDVFLLRQKHLAISEKYVVWDEDGRPILFIERPVHLLRGLAALLGAILAFLLVAGVFFAAAMAINVVALQIVFGILALVGGLVAVVVVAVALYPKRHVSFYRDESRGEKLLEVLQDRKLQLIVATYTIVDAAGQLLARLRKNYLYNVIRKRWECSGPDGSPICLVKEDSVVLSLLRRFMGPLFGVLRTNFILLDPATERVIGEFNRKFTILDRYVLDLKADPGRALDRRIALAIGVMLDTGERR